MNSHDDDRSDPDAEHRAPVVPTPVHRLNYAKSQKPNHGALLMMGGFCIGIVASIFLGILIGILGPGGRGQGAGLAIFFTILAIIFLATVRSTWRDRRIFPPRLAQLSHLEIGVFLGLGIGCLLEGLCFGAFSQ